MELTAITCLLLLAEGLFCLPVVLYRLRGTSTGANNRMDLLTLVTSGVNNNEVGDPEEDILGIVERWRDDETHNPDVPAVSHKRGLTPFIFVPFDQVIAFSLELHAYHNFEI